MLEPARPVTYDAKPGHTMTEHGTAPPSPERWDELVGLLAIADTNGDARDKVIGLLYPELKRIAAAQMRRERPDHTLQATGLVSEFFVYLARSTTSTPRTRAHF